MKPDIVASCVTGIGSTKKLEAYKQEPKKEGETLSASPFLFQAILLTNSRLEEPFCNTQLECATQWVADAWVVTQFLT